MLKYLRIAVTALSLTACVLLIALWVRSYRSCDSAISLPSTLPRQYSFQSMHGRLKFFVTQRNPRSRVDFPLRWRIDGDPIRSSIRFPTIPKRPMWKYEVDNRGGRVVIIPHWSPVLLFGAIATYVWLPWFKWRFSLHTLLIATMLVAVVLGIVVAAR